MMMLGPDIDHEDKKGIIPRMVGGIFAKFENVSSLSNQMSKLLWSKFTTNENIKDLLAPKKNNLRINKNRELGIYV